MSFSTGAGHTGCSRWLPKSTGIPSILKLPALPPTELPRSSTVTSRQPRCTSLYAAANPAGPPPRMTSGTWSFVAATALCPLDWRFEQGRGDDPRQHLRDDEAGQSGDREHRLPE